MKASSVGRPCAVLCDVMTAATTAVPMLLPMVRDDRVDAGRLAGLGGGHALDDGVGHGREGQADAGAGEQAGARAPARAAPWHDGGQGERAGDQHGAEEQRHLGPEAAVQQAGQRPEDDHHQHGGQQEQARLRHRLAEPVAGRRRAARAASGRAGRCRTSRSRGPGRRGWWPTPRGLAIRRMSMSGSRTRSSTRTNTTSATTPSASRRDGLAARASPRPGPC